MMNYKEEYLHWLDSPALSTAEWEELKADRKSTRLNSSHL